MFLQHYILLSDGGNISNYPCSKKNFWTFHITWTIPFSLVFHYIHIISTGRKNDKTYRDWNKPTQAESAGWLSATHDDTVCSCLQRLPESLQRTELCCQILIPLLHFTWCCLTSAAPTSLLPNSPWKFVPCKISTSISMWSQTHR